MVRPCVAPLLVLALVTGVFGADKDETQWAEVASQGARPNSTAVLHVQNRASVPVRLMGCSGTEVQPNQTLDVPLAGLVRFWVVANGTDFDCHKGPFDELFYVAADLLGQKPLVTVGYGMGKKKGLDKLLPGSGNGTNASEPIASEGNGTDAGERASDADDQPAVAGLELSAGPPGGSQPSVRCREDKCDASQEVPSWPTEFTLTVVGPQSSLLSFWYGGYGGGWGHHGWGHHGWGHRGWGHRRWGYGWP